MKPQEDADNPDGEDWEVINALQIGEEGNNRTNHIRNAERYHDGVEGCTSGLIGNLGNKPRPMKNEIAATARPNVGKTIAETVSPMACWWAPWFLLHMRWPLLLLRV